MEQLIKQGFQETAPFIWVRGEVSINLAFLKPVEFQTIIDSFLEVSERRKERRDS